MGCVSEVGFGLLESDEEPQVLAIDLVALLVELVGEWAVFALLDEIDIGKAIVVDGDVAFAFRADFFQFLDVHFMEPK